jgi:endonuclease/exonuclease/phosphatase family metal-dependent hydrolase
MLSILTINAALQDIRIFGCPIYRPIAFIQQRLPELASQIRRINPDIVCLQELFHHELQQQFYSLLDDMFPYACGFAQKGLKFRLANELITLSKFPIKNGNFFRFHDLALEEHLFTNKGFYKMIIEIPGTVEIQLINIHMTAGGLRQHPESHVMERIRSRQIQQVIKQTPFTSPVILAGDLNAGPGSSRKNYDEIINSGFTDTFSFAGGKGISWNPDNPLIQWHGEHHLPPQRVDHIFINKPAAQMIEPLAAEIVLDNADILLTNGSKIPVSDHYGVLVTFNSLNSD